MLIFIGCLFSMAAYYPDSTVYCLEWFPKVDIFPYIANTEAIHVQCRKWSTIKQGNRTTTCMQRIGYHLILSSRQSNGVLTRHRGRQRPDYHLLLSFRHGNRALDRLWKMYSYTYVVNFQLLISSKMTVLLT